MLSLHLGLRRAVPPAAIVGFSGLLAGAAAAAAEFPPILLTHGDSDQVIPPQAMLPGGPASWARRGRRCNGTWPAAWAMASIR